jgi:ribose/xylose/arabinose/galactoside ABC-type transport system permease subunit
VALALVAGLAAGFAAGLAAGFLVAATAVPELNVTPTTTAASSATTFLYLDIILLINLGRFFNKRNENLQLTL